jgi:hypothetical protein
VTAPDRWTPADEAWAWAECDEFRASPSSLAPMLDAECVLDPVDIGPAAKWRRAGRFLAIAIPVSWVVTLWLGWLLWPVLP